MPRIDPESMATKSDIVMTSIDQFYLNLVLAVHEKAVSKDAPVCKSNVNGKIGTISVFRWFCVLPALEIHISSHGTFPLDEKQHLIQDR
jgi:hypothetical protein